MVALQFTYVYMNWQVLDELKSGEVMNCECFDRLLYVVVLAVVDGRCIMCFVTHKKRRKCASFVFEIVFK
jgi:hypothetical protein